MLDCFFFLMFASDETSVKCAGDAMHLFFAGMEHADGSQ